MRFEIRYFFLEVYSRILLQLFEGGVPSDMYTRKMPGILSFRIFGTHKIVGILSGGILSWGILSQNNFSLGDFVMGEYVASGFCR